MSAPRSPQLTRGAGARPGCGRPRSGELGTQAAAVPGAKGTARTANDRGEKKKKQNLVRDLVVILHAVRGNRPRTVHRAGSTAGTKLSGKCMCYSAARWASAPLLRRGGRGVGRSGLPASNCPGPRAPRPPGAPPPPSRERLKAAPGTGGLLLPTQPRLGAAGDEASAHPGVQAAPPVPDGRRPRGPAPASPAPAVTWPARLSARPRPPAAT